MRVPFLILANARRPTPTKTSPPAARPANPNRRAPICEVTLLYETSDDVLNPHRLPVAPIVHHDGGSGHAQGVLEEREVVRAPQQRTAMDHQSLDRRTNLTTVTSVRGSQRSGGLVG